MNNQNGTMRMSLPSGTVLQGKKNKYTVNKMLCRSDRSISVSAQAENGKTCRIKYYNGDSVVNMQMLAAFCGLKMKGVLPPADAGEYGGCCFAVYPQIDVKSADQYPIQLEDLVTRVIPQLAYVIGCFHSKRVLLRDISPAHIFYSPQRKEIAYAGFSNAAMLPGKATVTKQPGFGEEPWYLAPETDQYGYSTCSDYFALGMTLLTLVKGKNPAASMDRKTFLAELSKGNVPGIDVAHLKQTKYALYSEEDRVMYLILGLLLPDPRQRWGSGEIRCWLNHQQIPLVQQGTRIPYHFNAAFTVGGEHCWNQKQLAAVIASRWDLDTAKLAKFATEKNLRCAPDIASVAADKTLNENGRIFRCIYLLDPGTSKLWWKGKSYSNMEELVEKASKTDEGKRVLSELLQERCFSFLGQNRSKVTDQLPDITELAEIEQLEKREPGKGLNRCMMRFAASTKSRFFTFKGKNYHDVGELLKSYTNRGDALKKDCVTILQDQTFQAWLWANGLERASAEAVAIARKEPEKSFYPFLSLCESATKDESAKRQAREFYLHWGDHAPIVYLARHISDYSVTSEANQTRYDTFAKASFDTSRTLDQLQHQAQQLVIDYQNFVGRTLSNPFLLESGADLGGSIGYVPLYETGYFCCTWENGIEVSPDFLRSVKVKPDEKKVKEWANQNAREESERLNELRRHLPADTDADGSRYVNSCRLNIAAAVFMIIAILILAIIGATILVSHTEYTAIVWYVVATALVAGAFPLFSFGKYYRLLVRSKVWVRNNAYLANRIQSIEHVQRQLDSRASEVSKDIMQNNRRKTQQPPQDMRLSDAAVIPSGTLDPLGLNVGMRILAYVSLSAVMLLATPFSGDVGEAMLYYVAYGLLYAGAAPFAIRKWKFVDSCIEWAISITAALAVMLIGIVFFGAKFVSVMVVLPFIIGGIILAVVIALMFFG